MSETAQTLIKAALRSIGAIATGETPTAAEMADGLESMKLMFRSWSAKNIRLYYTKQETLTMGGASSYTIGSGGDKFSRCGLLGSELVFDEHFGRKMQQNVVLVQVQSTEREWRALFAALQPGQGRQP